MTHEQKNILSVRDMEREEIDKLLSSAAAFDRGNYTGRELEGKILAVLFFEPSTRTRMSFSAAMMRLGGQDPQSRLGRSHLHHQRRDPFRHDPRYFRLLRRDRSASPERGGSPSCRRSRIRSRHQRRGRGRSASLPDLTRSFYHPRIHADRKYRRRTSGRSQIRKDRPLPRVCPFKIQ